MSRQNRNVYDQESAQSFQQVRLDGKGTGYERHDDENAHHRSHNKRACPFLCHDRFLMPISQIEQDRYLRRESED